jgi:hypothetical protein
MVRHDPRGGRFRRFSGGRRAADPPRLRVEPSPLMRSHATGRSRPRLCFFFRGSAAQSRGLFTSSVVRALDFVRAALPRVGGVSADSRRVSCSSGTVTPDSAHCSWYCVVRSRFVESSASLRARFFGVAVDSEFFGAFSRERARIWSFPRQVL